MLIYNDKALFKIANVFKESNIDIQIYEIEYERNIVENIFSEAVDVATADGMNQDVSSKRKTETDHIMELS